jgi:hexosaminidase
MKGTPMLTYPVSRHVSVAILLTLIFNVKVSMASTDIIPAPSSVREMPGTFVVTGNTPICVEQDVPDVQQVADYLADLVAVPLSHSRKVQVTATPPPGSIFLSLKGADPLLGNEGYELDVTKAGIVIRASASAGLFYGVQTLRQLLPPSIEPHKKIAGDGLAVSCAVIRDSPRFRWRGLMLDVSRHFFDKHEVEKILDVMALYKLNVFHWHLVDDQGWRIEIKRYPKLTEVGAWRDGIGFRLDPKRSDHYDAQGRYGGFYTQDDIREVVAYAARLHILVVPEIEMPGHSSAALAAYPQFSSGGVIQKIPEGAGVFGGVYNPADEATFTFLQNVLTEVMGLFPSPYIHIGGDEVPKGPWKKNAACQALMKAQGLANEQQLQSYFIRRIQKFIASKGRRMIGWDEILEGGLAPDATVMSWRGTAGGIAAVKAGHDVVMAPDDSLYFTRYEAKLPDQPPAAGGVLPLLSVYQYDPVPPGLTEAQATHVLGAEACIWTEWMPNLKQVEYQALPRLCALAEITWTPHSQLNWNDFVRRVGVTETRLTALNVNFFKNPNAEPLLIGSWQPNQMSQTFKTMSWDVTPSLARPGKLSVEFQFTNGSCRLDIASVALMQNGKEISRDEHPGLAGSRDKDNVYRLDVPGLAPGASYQVSAQVRGDGGTNSSGTVTLSLDAPTTKP